MQRKSNVSRSFRFTYVWLPIPLALVLAILGIIVFSLTFVLVTAIIAHAAELPYNEDMSAAFNGTWLVDVSGPDLSIVNYVTGEQDIGADLTWTIFCNPANTFPDGYPSYCDGSDQSYAFDSRAKYDWRHDRWIVSGGIYDETAFWLAASLTDDPTGEWYVYQIQTCGWDQPEIGLDGEFVTETADFCGGSTDATNQATWRGKLSALESGAALTPDNSWLMFAGTDGVYAHLTSDSGPLSASGQFTALETAVEGSDGYLHPALQIGRFIGPKKYVVNWKTVSDEAMAFEAGGPLTDGGTFDQPGAPQSLVADQIGIESSVHADYNGEGYIFAGYPVEAVTKANYLQADITQTYSAELFAVPTGAGSPIAVNFTGPGEIMDVNMHVDSADGLVIVGTIETGADEYPSVTAYQWDLKTNTVSGPTVVCQGNALVTGYNATRWSDFIDATDLGNGVADLIGQCANVPQTQAIGFLPAE